MKRGDCKERSGLPEPPMLAPPSSPARQEYPWYTVSRIANDDQNFYATLVSCLYHHEGATTRRCTGICTGRCRAEGEGASVSLRAHGIRTMGPSQGSSHLHRHRVLCGTIPLYVLSNDDSPAPPAATSDTFVAQFGTFCGLSTVWASIDRNTWTLNRLVGRYVWTKGAIALEENQNAHSVPKKQVYVWHLRSSHSNSGQSLLKSVCTHWERCGFVSAVVKQWALVEQTEPEKGTTANAEDSVNTVATVLQNVFGIVLTPVQRTKLQGIATHVYGDAQDTTTEKYRILKTFAWSPAHLSSALVQTIRAHDTRRVGTFGSDQLSDLVRALGMNAEYVHQFIQCKDLQMLSRAEASRAVGPPTGKVHVALLCVHVSCVFASGAGLRLPLKKTIVTQHAPQPHHRAREVHYYELLEAWDTGVPALDARLWEAITYTSPDDDRGSDGREGAETPPTSTSSDRVVKRRRYRGRERSQPQQRYVRGGRRNDKPGTLVLSQLCATVDSLVLADSPTREKDTEKTRGHNQDGEGDDKNNGVSPGYTEGVGPLQQGA